MNVLFIANSFPSPDKKNAGPFNLRAVQHLQKAGLNAEVFHLRSWSPGKKPAETYMLDGVKVTAISLPYYVGFKPGLLSWNLLLYKKMLTALYGKKIREGKFDVIHSVGAGHAGIIASEIAKKFNIPHVAQCIGSDVNIILPEIYKNTGVKGWEDHVKVFVSNSIELKDKVLELYPDADSRVIYRGVNLKEFYPYANGQNNKEVIVSYIGGLSPKETKPFGMDQKGGITLLNAWKKFRNAEPDAKSLLMFGGPNVNKEVVTGLLQQDPASLGVQVVGHMDRQTVAEFFRNSDVVIIPSMFEGLPNVAMEAAASGCALIGTKVGGIPEVIMENRNGFLVHKKNENQLADRLQKIILDKDLLNSCKIESRKYMEEKFDSAQFAEGYISLYREVIHT
ncbi:MAG: glycosyltransferase family 4 protein [Flavitalea sp.]